MATSSASGTRFLIDLYDCRRGITLDQEFSLEAIVNAVHESGMTVKNASFVPYPDGTVNAHCDLGESHFSMGTYRVAKHVSGELNVCNESQNNRLKGRKAVKKIAALFQPTKMKVTEHTWKSLK